MLVEDLVAEDVEETTETYDACKIMYEDPEFTNKQVGKLLRGHRERI
jgi:hypothetical protein